MALFEKWNIPVAAFNGTSVSVDYASYLSQHDIVYQVPPRLGEQGMPIGDGDLGAMLWCPDGEVRLQINKTDLWWENPTPQLGRWEDWRLLSAGTLSIRTDPSPLHNPLQFEQRLNLYYAQVSLQANALEGACHLEAWVAATANVVCVEYQDQILRARTRTVELTAMRNARPFAIGEYIGLVEALPDRRIAVVCRLVGSKATVGWKDSKTVKMDIQTARGAQFTLYLAVGVAGVDGDPVGIAKRRLEGAIARGATVLTREHRMHWRGFWQKSFLRLASPDGLADYLENLWYFHLYQLASCSRAHYMPKFNGGLWLANGDERAWGGGYWHWNTQMLYWPTFAANHLELTHTYFESYSRMLPVFQRETRRRFGLGGVRMPEVINRFGEDIAQPDNPYVRLILSSGLECAMQFWWCWQFSRDYHFLRERAYPFLKACVQFYREYAKREPDGTVCIYPSNAYENRTDVKNPPNDLAALRFGLKALIEASKVLEQDEAERPLWQEFLQRLPDYPRIPESDIWSEGIGGKERINAQLPELAPVFPSGEVGIGSPEYERAVRTFHLNDRGHNRYGWSIDSIIAARLGLRLEIADLLREHVQKFQIYPQGFFHYAGQPPPNSPENIPYLEPLGMLATALNEMCVQGYDGTLRVFPALPPGWAATFMLRTAGGFVVMAETEGKEVLWVAILSLTGETCRLQNPWQETARVGLGKTLVLRSDAPLLEFDTEHGNVYLIDRTSQPLSKMLRHRLTGKRNMTPKCLGSRKIGLASG
jgi:alpha-L-fucosidase 2